MCIRDRDAEDPPQPARLAAIAAASATNKALFFIFHILLYLTYFFRQPSSLKDYIAVSYTHLTERMFGLRRIPEAYFNEKEPFNFTRPLYFVT